MGRHPEVKWAQRSDKVFLTVELPDAINPKVNIEPEGRFTFSATAGPENTLYELDLQFFDKINVEESKISVGSRHVFCAFIKAEKKWWKRLLTSDGKPPPYLKADWDKWVDEDEENDGPSNKFDNFDLGSMSDFSDLNMGGAGMSGLDAGDESDSDDEVPELIGKDGLESKADVAEASKA
ncbi:hypothetical protein KP509_15G075800 [Ceratopteris richardii]|uniref:CS domain-containing protein n=1 Tax=Ceratopteris richardii TaxID=49495 RepID=A0A8T2T4W0_CERRI|nr:hypothetical protein KP509_15G075800 [Ceratopteris richardii]